MVLKKARQEKILDLISRHDIQTQEEMIVRLEESGYPVTQATVSRDIRELSLVKSLSKNGVYCYALPAKKEVTSKSFNSAMTDSVLSVEHAGNMLVVKTYPGLASAVATCIDSLNIPDILGSIAGDDAIFIVVREAAHAGAVCERLRRMIYNL